MHYQVSRNGQMYGPYTLEDLQRYVTSGNVLPTDLAKSEDMPDWLPVSQILGPAQAAAPAFSTPLYGEPTSPSSVDPAYRSATSQGGINPALASSPYPDAPNLHWGLVLLFSFLSCFLFPFIWDIVIAAWLKRVQPNAKSLYWYLGALGLSVIRFFVGLATAASVLRHSQPGNVYLSPSFVGFAALSSLLGLATIIIIIVANFMKRASLEEHFNGPEPVGLQLNAVMTFFFAPWYFQYHLNRINALKQAARYGAGRAI